MKKSNRNGFTIVELVIVIAVIAILAAVLIPTFTNLIKKANESSDVQAVRQMNTILSAEGAVEKNNIFDVFDALHEAGLDAKNYKPLVNGTYFFWDDEADRVVYTDSEFNVIFPKGFSKQGNWFSLTQTIEAKAPNGFTAESTAVTVTNGAEMVYVLDQLNAGQTNKTLTITIPAEGIDMMGAAFSVPYIGSADGKVTGYNIEITGGPIKNATAINVSDADGKSSTGQTGEGHDGMYGCSLFGIVQAGNTLNIHDVVFENINIKNTHASGSAILVGAVYSSSSKIGTVNISNVTINNSTVIGHRSVGALVGIQQGAVTLGGTIALNNVNVLAVGGRSGLLFGQNGNNSSNQAFTNNATISANSCKVDVYKCAQNTGEYNGNPLGLKDDGKVYSWFYSFSNGEWAGEYKGYAFNSKAVQGIGTFAAPAVTGWN